MANYFNTLNLRQQLAQLGKCRFMTRDEFADEASYLKGKKVVIVGCGALKRLRKNALPGARRPKMALKSAPMKS